MRRIACRAATVTATFVFVGLMVAGCASSTDREAEPSSPSATTTTTQAPAPGAVSVSPGGVTTAVGVPAESTEEEYFQACHAAKEWMAQQGGDPKSQIEPYLKTLQTSDSAGPGTYGTPWSQLAPARQAGVIVAVQAAADALCG
jgi:Putative lipoprotein LpqV